MAKYFMDTEFHEYHKQPKVCGIKVGKAIPTIDLISIGIVSEDFDKKRKMNGVEYEAAVYYAISKDFNIKDAWYSYQYEDGEKVYWLRKNVLRKIFIELYNKEYNASLYSIVTKSEFTLKKFTKLVKKYGKTNKEIAEDIFCFCNPDFYNEDKSLTGKLFSSDKPTFYAFFADYDWVVFAQLFGKMNDLPKGFPYYCIDLKQMLDEKAESLTSAELSKLAHGEDMPHNVYSTYDSGVLKCSKTDLLKNALDFPEQIDEHNALSDAIWNKKLYKFLKNI